MVRSIISNKDAGCLLDSLLCGFSHYHPHRRVRRRRTPSSGHVGSSLDPRFSRPSPSFRLPAAVASQICVFIFSRHLRIPVALSRALIIHLYCSVTSIHSYLLFVPLSVSPPIVLELWNYYFELSKPSLLPISKALVGMGPK